MIPEPEELGGLPIGKSRSGFQVAPLAVADWRARQLLKQEEGRRPETKAHSPNDFALKCPSDTGFC